MRTYTDSQHASKGVVPRHTCIDCTTSAALPPPVTQQQQHHACCCEGGCHLVDTGRQHGRIQYLTAVLSVCVCVCILTTATQVVTCNLASTDLLMNSDHKRETRSVWPSLLVRIPTTTQNGMNRHFQCTWISQLIGTPLSWDLSLGLTDVFKLSV